MKKGFTLVELLVVIAIIAVLSAVGLASYQTAARSGKDGKRKADLSQVRSALELYRSQLNAYPAGPIDAMLSTLRTASYISDPLPKDPTPTRSYTYTVSGSTYCLCAQLDTVGTGNSSNTSCNGTAGNYLCVTQP